MPLSWYPVKSPVSQTQWPIWYTHKTQRDNCTNTTSMLFYCNLLNYHYSQGWLWFVFVFCALKCLMQTWPTNNMQINLITDNTSSANETQWINHAPVSNLFASHYILDAWKIHSPLKELFLENTGELVIHLS